MLLLIIMKIVIFVMFYQRLISIGAGVCRILGGKDNN